MNQFSMQFELPLLKETKKIVEHIFSVLSDVESLSMQAVNISIQWNETGSPTLQGIIVFELPKFRNDSLEFIVTFCESFGSKSFKVYESQYHQLITMLTPVHVPGGLVNIMDLTEKIHIPQCSIKPGDLVVLGWYRNQWRVYEMGQTMPHGKSWPLHGVWFSVAPPDMDKNVAKFHMFATNPALEELCLNHCKTVDGSEKNGTYFLAWVNEVYPVGIDLKTFEQEIDYENNTN